MSRRAEIEHRLRRLDEISDIMTAMKTLALIETRKFNRFMGHQRRLIQSIEAATSDFLAFHPAFRSGVRQREAESHVLILIGSERGFCGDFNEAIMAALAALPPIRPRLVVVGRRLASKLQARRDLEAWLDGPNVAEEVRAVLNELMTTLHRLWAESAQWKRLSVLSHDSEGGVASHVLLPIMPAEEPVFAYPPRLNLDPALFFAELTEHYLFAKLPGLFYASLMAENRQRLEHMENALRRMDTKIQDLRRKSNALRQEEIVEEIEIILLSAESLLSNQI
ncbi:FoF1 ATP synthase subunit gamma [Methylocaldum sp. RMAD-M]|uniref:F0F1 ATP synthase subunit gamma n=1 Tax=unclassified Methylocaldum TaxID=2622260 RepID=UPI000A326128|nr:FoF1 ATP synthase subunit gamma [Methylocaldum sp. RMAD-M]MBP1151720.1 F-type H+-transporting ATPase subunit gamma [Methylocaldum sp. RMAD-M]